MNDKFCQNEDDTISFLVNAPEIAQIRVALSKQNVRILKEENSVWLDDKLTDILMNVEGTIEDIEFALTDLIKFIRPYPNRRK